MRHLHVNAQPAPNTLQLVANCLLFVGAYRALAGSSSNFQRLG